MKVYVTHQFINEVWIDVQWTRERERKDGLMLKGVWNNATFAVLSKRQRTYIEMSSSAYECAGDEFK